MVQEIKNKFLELFSSDPLLISAPGRINLIGEHTDYNNGFVLPAAINKRIIFAVSPNTDSKHKFYSYDLKESIELPVNQIQTCGKQWANYLLGVIAQIQKTGKNIGGINCVFGGDIPLGAGLSSSAALETGFAFALNEVFKFDFERLEMVKMSQIAEHEYAGVKCGIMDQFASMFGEKDMVIRLDCRSLNYELFPLPLENFDILLCDTQVKHSLASSEYNTRREECEMGVKILSKHYGNTESLRDATMEQLNSHKDEFDPVVFKRCKFVVEENQRLLDACEALSKSNISEFGNLMYQTHAGLRDEYAVSCSELDILVDIARSSGKVVGSRMMGGGFGGCTINIVEKSAVDGFIEQATNAYLKQTKKKLKVYNVSIESGTSIISQ